jgi:hypothetical protein
MARNEKKSNAKMSKGIESTKKQMDEGARLGVNVNHKVKLHGVRKYTQDQPGVEDGKQKHHTGLPGVRTGEMQKKIAKK